MRVHFIAIGGAAMHNLAIALKTNGWVVSGSDDEIFEPSVSRLKSVGLLPEKFGWFPDKINKDLDLIILGMHARKDNPELLRAQELGLTINSYPEFIYEQSKSKKRVVIAGSHGKTTTTSMILHVLKAKKFKFDFMVGAKIEGFDTMVSLSDAPIIILEGDEYFSSPIDMKAKFLWYKPNLALITGISWDHINVYPTFESYEKAFIDFISSIDSNGKLIYFDDDILLKILAMFAESNVKLLPYETLEHEIINGKTKVRIENQEYSIKIFGTHNLQNLQGARLICNSLGIDDHAFFESIQTFVGAANRLELLAESRQLRVFKDFAHSPSKLKATISACKNQFKDGLLLSVMELHTFSSLNKKFLKEYKNTMDESDLSIVYFNPETIAHKKLETITAEDVVRAFNKKDLVVITDAEELKQTVIRLKEKCSTVLLMSSGNFNGLDLKSFALKMI